MFLLVDGDIGGVKNTVDAPAERTNRPGPLSIRFDIVDAQIKHNDHGKYVVCHIFCVISRFAF